MTRLYKGEYVSLETEIYECVHLVKFRFVGGVMGLSIAVRARDAQIGASL